MICSNFDGTPKFESIEYIARKVGIPVLHAYSFMNAPYRGHLLKSSTFLGPL